jgi:tripartite-type tricarboxylate transporter receptor subunit TctC
MMDRRAVLTGICAVGASSLVSDLYAAEYPDRMIRYIVPFPPGGAVDILGRVLSEKLQGSLKQTVIVDNRPGAGGMVGTRFVAKSAPDGYSILAASFNFLTLPVLFKDMDFDIIKDFEPISLVATFPMVLVVTPSVKAKSLKEIIELSKSSGGLKFGSSSTGGGGHIGAELLNQRAGLHNIHVPYKGAAPMIVDLLSGSIDFAFAHITSITPQVESGAVRALAVTAKTRSALLPEVPTMAEAGMPDFEVGEIHGVLFPANTPRNIVELINQEILAALKLPDIKEKLAAQGAQIVGTSPEQFAEYIKVESVKWGKVAKDAGLTAS